MPNNIQAALEHFGSWERLLKMIDDKLSFYLRIPRIFQLMEDGGLHPASMLDATGPAYFSDAIAMRCLRSHDPNETDDDVLEHCMVMQLHESFELAEKADRTIVSAQGGNWEQYTTDALLRLAWRLRGKEMEIPFFLTRCGASELSEAFLLTLSAKTAVLVNCAKDRSYELSLEKILSFPEFSQELCRCFRLATEENGYFVPEYVWLCADALA